MKVLTLSQIKSEIIKYSTIIWQKAWVANHEGNITVKFDDKKIVSTPTSMSKGEIKEDDLLILDNYGKVITGKHRVFSEISMHLTVYRNRPDVRAVIHAHPPTATGLSVSGVSLNQPIIPEIVVSIGKEVPLVPFALPWTEIFKDNIVKYLEFYDVLLLKNHGVLSYGDNLQQAYLRLEHVEHFARIYLTAHLLGKIDVLSQSDVNELLRVRRKAGLGAEGRRK